MAAKKRKHGEESTAEGDKCFTWTMLLVINNVIPLESGSPRSHPVFYFVSLFHGKKFDIFESGRFQPVKGCQHTVAFSEWLGRIQDLVKGDSEKLLPTLSNCYLTSPFFTRKSMVKILVFVSL